MKIKEFIDDYYIDLKRYYKKLKKILKKSFRVLRFHCNNPKSKVIKKIITCVKNFNIKLRNVVENILLTSKYRKRNLIITGALIVVCLFLLILYPSFAYYSNIYEFNIFSGVVGDMYANKFDYSLLIYVEDINSFGEGTGSYHLTSDIPTYNYSYSGYKCNNNSILTYDTNTTLTSVTLNQKDICSVYFDVINPTDISIQIMVEDLVGSNSYKLSNYIPPFGYKYSHYECSNNSILTYNNKLHKINVATNSKEQCQVYFKEEEVDIEVKIFIEQNYGFQDYIARLDIPSNKEYVLSDRSVCFNENNERVETNIGYIDGYVEVNAFSISYCQVYLDLQNE